MDIDVLFMRKTLLIMTAINLLLFSCQGGESITIGFVGDLTGPVSDLGSQSRNGVLMAVEEWNKQGGLRGKAIELIIRDDQHRSDYLKKHLNELADIPVQFIVGPTSSSMALIAAPLATEREILLLGTSVSSDLLSGKDDYFFRVMPTARTSSLQLMDYLISHVEFENYAILMDTSNHVYTETWMSSMLEGATKAHKINHYSAQFISGDNLSLLNAIDEQALGRSDLILICANPIDAALLIRQIRSFNREAVIAGCEWLATIDMLGLAGDDAEGVYYSRFGIQTPHSASYIALQERFEYRFQKPLDAAALVSYVITNAGLNALATKTKKQTVKDALLAHPTLEKDIADFQFDEFGDLATKILSFVGQVQNQQFVDLPE